MPRLLPLLAASLAVVITLPATAASGAVPLAVAACASGTPVTADYDGDGKPDQFILANQAGQVRYTSGGTSVWAHHATSVRSADLNGDTCADAVISPFDPSEHVTLVQGTASGLDFAGATTLDPTAAVVGEDDGGFGRLTAIGLRHDGISQVVIAGVRAKPYLYVYTIGGDLNVNEAPQVIDMGPLGANSFYFAHLAADHGTLAVGSSSDTVKGRFYAGAVYLFSADHAAPPTLVFRTRITQDSPGMATAAEQADQFGAAVDLRDGRLAIGVPQEDYAGHKGTGIVQTATWNESTLTLKAGRMLHQGTPGIAGTNEKYDAFGTTVRIARGLTAAGSYDVVIGSYEDVGRKDHAGSVTVANFTRALYRTYTQDTKGIPGSAETEDNFGSAIGLLPTNPKIDTLLIGAPTENTGTCSRGGYVIRSDGRKLSSRTAWTSVPPPDCDSFGVWGWTFGD